MDNHLAFIILAFYFGLAVTGTAQDFSNTFLQGSGQGLNYMDSYHPSYYPYYDPSYYPSDYLTAYWNSPNVPVKCAVQAAKERLWANKYINPNSVWWQVQGTKERLWAVRNACRTCWPEQEYGWSSSI